MTDDKHETKHDRGIGALRAALRQGAMSRRQFIAAALAAGAGMAGALRMADAEAAPRKGGRFRIGIGRGSTTDTLDPGTFNDTYMQTVGLAMRNCLTEADNNDRLIGELAESFEAGAGAKTWTFKLRKGVEFHNGKSLTSDDVVASLRHHIGESSTSVAKGFMEGIESVKKDGKRAVVVKLKDGNADFPFLMSDYHISIMPEKDGKPDWQSGAGTGGYVLERFEPGVKTTLKRNPNYWKSGRAHFDEIEAIVTPDAAARTSGIKSATFDAIDRVDLKTVNRLARDKSIKIIETQGTLHFTYSMFCDKAPFDNADVRLALKYGINREEFLAKILQGHGYLGNDHPIGKSNRYYNKQLPQRPYDPERAKAHLKKAGLSSLKVKLHVADEAFAGAVDGAVLYREAAAKAGIDLEVAREPNDGYWSNVWNVQPFAASYWSGRLTEDWMFSTTYARGVPWNETHWDNKRFNDLLLKARVELAPAKRAEMYGEMQKLVSDDGGAVIPAFANYVFAVSDKIGHDRMSAAWDLDGIKCAERWWFKA